MASFTPGASIKTFTSKNGREVILRFPKEDDLQQLTDFINEVSKEDTFISLSGEQFTLEEEKKYVDDVLKKMQEGTVAKIVATINNQIVGTADVTRQERRTKTVGIFGITIAKDYRGEGIGQELIETCITLAKQMELRMLRLSCYSLNTAACVLYKKVGFEEVGKIPQNTLYKNDFIDEIIMVKFL